jgi:hypothetical protein
VAGLTPAEEASARRELASAGILGEGGLWFADAAIQPAVYATIPSHDRSPRHRDAALLLVAQRAGLAEIAEHLMRVEPAGDDDVVARLRAAGRDALANGKPEHAARYLRRALAEPPHDDELAATAHELGRSAALAGEPAAPDDLRAALEYAKAPEARAEVAAELAIALYCAGRLDECVAVADDAIAELGDDADPELASALEGARACVELVDARFAIRLESRLPHLRALAVAATAGGRALAILEGFWRWQRRLPGPSPRRLVERGLARDDLDGAVGPVCGFAIAMFALQDETARAERLVDQVLAQARRSGSVRDEAMALAWRSQVELRTGRVAAAERHAGAAVALTAGRPLGSIAPLARCFHAEALAARGRLADADEVIASVSLGGLEETVFAAYTLFVRGRLRLAQGRPAEAAADLRACAVAAGGLFTDNPEACPWRSTLAMAVELAWDERSEALELARAELALARRRRHVRAVAVALAACGAIEGGVAGLELLDQAVAALAETDSRLEHARALIQLGGALDRAGRPAPARGRLREGLVIALGAGAIATAERAAHVLGRCSHDERAERS